MAKAICQLLALSCLKRKVHVEGRKEFHLLEIAKDYFFVLFFENLRIATVILQIISNADHSRPLSKINFLANGKQHLIFGIFHDLQTAVCHRSMYYSITLIYYLIYMCIYIYTHTHIYTNIHIYTVGTESIQTPLNFSLFVILQPFAKIT